MHRDMSLPSLLILLSLDILVQGSGSGADSTEGGFIRAQCPRPEDIHPCTCTRMAKHEDDGSYESEFDDDRLRFARSAALHEFDSTNLNPSEAGAAASSSSGSTFSASPSSLRSMPSLSTTSVREQGEGEEADAASGASPTTTSESVPSDPEIIPTTSPPVFYYVSPDSSLHERDLSTLSPRFRATAANLLSSTHKPMTTTSDEVDVSPPPSTTLPSSFMDQDQSASVRHEPSVDTTPPPMDWLMGQDYSVTLSPRFTFPTTVNLIKSHENTSATPSTPSSTSTPETKATTLPSTSTTITTSTTAATTTAQADVTTETSSSPSSSLPSVLPFEQTSEWATSGTSAATAPPPPTTTTTTTSSHMMTEDPASLSSLAAAESAEMPPTSEKRIMMRPVTEDQDIPILAASASSSSSSSGGRPSDSDHWSLYETMLVCRNIRSSRVVADALSSMRGYHFNFVILDNVKLPQPFPFSQFQRFSFDYLDLLNLSSLQFVDNFNDKGRDYYYGRSNRGSPDLTASGSSRSSHKVNHTSASSPSSSSLPSSSQSWSPAGQAATDARKQQQSSNNSRSRRRRRK